MTSRAMFSFRVLPFAEPKHLCVQKHIVTQKYLVLFFFSNSVFILPCRCNHSLFSLNPTASLLLEPRGELPFR